MQNTANMIDYSYVTLEIGGKQIPEKNQGGRKLQILICPIRRLSGEISPGTESKYAAIISSSSEPDTCRIPNIAYVYRQYEDLDADVPGRSFARNDAAAIVDFLMNLAPEVDTIFCCCDAGESRSPAVAAAVCRCYGQDDSHIWKNPQYHPNMLVFQTLTGMMGIPVSDAEAEFLFYTNRKAFRDAIRKTRGKDTL